MQRQVKMTLLEYINIGNLNVRGITKNEEKRNVVKDATKYNIPILAVSETHIKGTVAHNCHAKRKKVTPKEKTSRQKKKAHAKRKNLTPKEKKSRQKKKGHAKRKRSRQEKKGHAK